MQKISSLDVDEPVIYRRANHVCASASVVVAEMEDDFHHFRITLQHDHSAVTDIAGESLRFPWSTCGREAAAKIEDLVGCRLGSLHKQLPTERRYAQCTHLFDLVQLAINHAGDGDSTHLYQSEVTLTPGSGAIQAELQRDGVRLLLWEIANGTITSPQPYTGTRIDSLGAWAHRQQMDAGLIEATLVLQRAVHVSPGKIYDWQNLKWASDQGLPPTCYTFQPDRAIRAARVVGSVRDYSSDANQMLGGKAAPRPNSTDGECC